MLARAWKTFDSDDFDRTLNRIGVGIGTYNARTDQHYQAVLRWASHSTDAQHFFERISEPDFSHQDRQAFVATTRALLKHCAGRPVDDDELWGFLKAFVIVHFDFQSEGSSRDAENAVERIRHAIPIGQRDQAAALWDHLIAKAGDLTPVGGGATRATLVDQLTRDGFELGPVASLSKDIDALGRESERALGDIKSSMNGLKLHRAVAYQAIRTALSEARFIQIDGEPGTGKSALLKEIAEECALNGPVLVLKDSRVHPRGWSAHANVLRVTDNITALLREFACAGEPILFIDGIDKITDPAVQLTINDVIRTIAADPGLSAWRILVTIREQNLKHLETWLDPDALQTLPIRTVAVKPLDDNELSVVARAFPRLRPLLSQPAGSDVILKRPFFLNALLGLAGPDAATQLPATEVELLKLWWELGAADRKDLATAQHRRNLLMQTANALVTAPNKPIAVYDMSPEALEELKSAGVLRDNEVGHSVLFTHDIFEEWTLCE